MATTLPIAPRKIATTVTASATLAKGRHTPVDATAGALTMTLPTDAVAGVEVSAEKTDASANAVTITGTMRGVASSTIPLATQFEARTFLSEGSGSWRPVSDHRTAASLSASFVPLARDAADGIVDATRRMRWTDQAGSPGSVFAIEHNGDGTGLTGGSAGQTYGLDIHNNVGARKAVVIHHYSQADVAFQIDNCGNQAMLVLNNTANATRAPGTDGTGPFMILADHGTNTLTWSKDHVLTMGAKTLTVLNNNTGQRVFDLQTAADLVGLRVLSASATATQPALDIDRRGSGSRAMLIRNSGANQFGIDTAGIPEWLAAGNAQTTVGAAGAASALPATPTKYLKVKDSAGTTYVIPAYAAS